VLIVAIALLILSQKVDELIALGDRGARSWEHLSNLSRWVMLVILGVNGNDWRERNLLARGYTVQTILPANSAQEALATHGLQEREKAHVSQPVSQ